MRAAPDRHPQPQAPAAAHASPEGGGDGSVRLPRDRDGPRTPGGSTGGRSPRQETKGHTAPGRGRGRRCPGSCRAETEGRSGLDARPGMVPPQRDSPRVWKGCRGAAAPTAPSTAPHSPDSAGQVTPSPHPGPPRTFKGGGRKRRGAAAAPVPAPQ